ncbi:hypothetical protein KC19_VG237300 [Ceratodon purpureus]|nr:hypothetical protein KC19_VG237300 [Ceratodon purpureus]
MTRSQNDEYSTGIHTSLKLLLQQNFYCKDYHQWKSWNKTFHMLIRILLVVQIDVRPGSRRQEVQPGRPPSRTWRPRPSRITSR